MAKNGKQIMLHKAIFTVSIIVIVLSLNSCTYRRTDEDVKVVKYEVTGTAKSVTITMVNADGETEEFNHVQLPWERNIYPRKGLLYLAVQNEKEEGSVAARIWINGKIIDKSTSNGAFVNVSVSGRVK